MDKFMVSFVLLLGFYSCVQFGDNELLSISEYTDKYVESEKEVFIEEDASSAIELTSKDGCSIKFRANSFLQDGVQYSGKVRIEFVMLHSKADMISAGMPTMFLDGQSNYSLLESGGEFLLRAYEENNEELRLDRRVEVFVPKSLMEPTDSLMTLFFMAQDGPAIRGNSNIWTGFVGLPNESLFNVDSGYKIFFENFEWINCDAFIEFDGPSHLIDFIYPNRFNESNSNVFISLDNYANSLATLDLAIPENETGHIILIARGEDQFYIVIDTFTSTANLEVDFSNKEIDEVPFDQMEQYLSDILN